MKVRLRPGRGALFTTRAKAAALRDSPERAILPLSGVFFIMR